MHDFDALNDEIALFVGSDWRPHAFSISEDKISFHEVDFDWYTERQSLRYVSNEDYIAFNYGEKKIYVYDKKTLINLHKLNGCLYREE